MNVLIVTARFGLGHVSAAAAIAEQINENYDDVNITTIDMMEFRYPTIHRGIYKAFSIFAGTVPGVYEKMVRMDQHLSAMPFREKFTKADIIGELVERYKPDVIISTWLIACKYIGAYKRKNRSSIPFITCVTDLGAYNEYISEMTDAYLVADDVTKAGFVAKGVEADRIYVSGIPVKQAFGKVLSKHDGKKKEVLIMGGGLGIISGADGLIENLGQREDVHATFITGTNRELKDQLTEEAGDRFDNIEILGYTDNVPYYMSRADVILTKAGGITLFESIQAEVPMLVPAPFFAQEKANADYIIRKGIGVVTDSASDDSQYEALTKMLDDEAGMKGMRNQMKHIKDHLRGNEISSIIYALTYAAEMEA